MSRPLPDSVDATLALLAHGSYVAERGLATVVHLALRLGRPLFLEGEAGVGKTEIAHVLARVLDRRLIRLQCYEGLDAAAALYEWNYARQMLEIRLAEAAATSGDAIDRRALEAELFDWRFLIKRPLLAALDPDPAGPPVLLIDEIDRADEPFEAFLLELLSDFQVTIPELGVVRAPEGQRPIVIITSNRTREVHDALRRRCYYHWVDYPSAERELAIVRMKVPAMAESLARSLVAFVQQLRARDLFKAPGVAEIIDWAETLIALDKITLDRTTIDETVGVLLKYQDDIARVRGAAVQELLDESRAMAEPSGDHPDDAPEPGS